MVNAYKSKFWLPLIVTLTTVLALSLAACMPVAPAPASAGTPAAAEEATVAPTEEATEEVPEEPTAESTEEPTEEAANGGIGIDILVSSILAKQLQIDVDQIEVVTLEAVDWPDACLGVYTADMMCAQVITPGYLVVLAVDGQQYEYHTNTDASFVQLFSAPEASVGEVLIAWEQTLDTCQAAQIGTEGIVAGPCMGVQLGRKLASPEREAQLADLIATYAPFEAETPAGMVTFSGQGSTEATPAEQRMIAEWVRAASSEPTPVSMDGLALTWHREGGFAGFCDEMTVYLTGHLDAVTCKGKKAENSGQRRMTAAELEQLYAWLDEYAPFQYHHDDGAAADSMLVELNFTGTGSTEADEATQEAILTFAQDIYTGAGQ